MPKYLHMEDIVQPTALLFAKRLKERRAQMGLSQPELAEQSGVTAAYISTIERGKGNPTLDVMINLAQALGLEVWDMIRPEPPADAENQG